MPGGVSGLRPGRLKFRFVISFCFQGVFNLIILWQADSFSTIFEELKVIAHSDGKLQEDIHSGRLQRFDNLFELNSDNTIAFQQQVKRCKGKRSANTAFI